MIYFEALLCGNTLEKDWFRFNCIRMNDKEKIEENDSLILAWDQYIQGQAELIENIRPEFQKVIQTYFMKNNKKVRDVLNSIQEFTQKEELKDPFHSGLTKSEKS